MMGNIFSASNKPKNALYEAILNGDTNQAVALLNHGFDPNMPFEPIYGYYPYGDKVVISADYPLHKALTLKQTALVMQLVNMGSDVNKINKDGLTPLGIAVDVNSDRSIVDFLLENGAKIHKASRDAITPLHRACYNNNREMVELLLSRGANPLFKDAYNKYPRDLTKNSEIKELLCKAELTLLKDKMQKNKTRKSFGCFHCL